MNFAGDFTSLNKKRVFDPPPFIKNITNINFATLTNRLVVLNTFLDSKNSLEVVPYSNKEHYWIMVLITQ